MAHKSILGEMLRFAKTTHPNEGSPWVITVNGDVIPSTQRKCRFGWLLHRYSNIRHIKTGEIHMIDLNEGVWYMISQKDPNVKILLDQVDLKYYKYAGINEQIGCNYWKLE